MTDLDREKATYILDASKAIPNWKAFPMENFPRMTAFVRASYELIHQVDGVLIYRRRGCDHPATAGGGRE
jgi:hypothetical protein